MDQQCREKHILWLGIMVGAFAASIMCIIGDGIWETYKEKHAQVAAKSVAQAPVEPPAYEPRFMDCVRIKDGFYKGHVGVVREAGGANIYEVHLHRDTLRHLMQVANHVNNDDLIVKVRGVDLEPVPE